MVHVGNILLGKDNCYGDVASRGEDPSIQCLLSVSQIMVLLYVQ